MPCCALIAFLLGQLYLASDWLSEKFGIRWASAQSSAAAWRPGATTSAKAGGVVPVKWLRSGEGRASLITGLLLLEAMCLVLIIRDAAQGPDIDSLLANSAHWCGHLVGAS